ncbi:unnamed protein product [Prorocentrum cordatum]|uniref:Alkaline phosphatase n=1 Tax=Prorocentrum cordatum TaxID=2364126 RepID=A0ABN9Y9F6_9DINO|nr:unnamed protein product [Polarella glacialis]|mmetsp:Transcript_19995/g.52426  ORF Transcript_19995/g.52426 Transcript_19995/m.52426 type:complete len:394 (+) Transcript_19995:124-1305(+)
MPASRLSGAALALWATAVQLAASPVAAASAGRLSMQPQRLRVADPPKIGATVSGVQQDYSPASTSTSARYLVASFPKLKQVAYVHLPDNVWRPLVIGNVSEPGAVATDSTNRRLFVADPPNQVIWWYHLTKGPAGLLETTGERAVAVANCTASWMSANGVGDLYFIGRKTGADRESVFRQTAGHIGVGGTVDPTEIFSRSNSGSPNAMAWAPAGLAVDAFHVYWGNEANGTVHGSIVQAPRHDSGTVAQDSELKTLNSDFSEVRGMTVTGTHVFWVAPDGVHGMRKGMSDAPQGMVAAAPGGGDGAWMPKSIAFDGDASLYFTEQDAGVLYQIPAQNLNTHELTKFVDAPNVDSLSVLELFQARGTSGATRGASRTGAALLVACAALATWAGA